MRLFKLDPLSTLAILALLLVLSAPFERARTTASRTSQTVLPADVKAHGASANARTPARIQKAVPPANTLH